jgi:hypothetical protein
MTATTKSKNFWHYFALPFPAIPSCLFCYALLTGRLLEFQSDVSLTVRTVPSSFRNLHSLYSLKPQHKHVECSIRVTCEIASSRPPHQVNNTPGIVGACAFSDVKQSLRNITWDQLNEQLKVFTLLITHKNTLYKECHAEGTCIVVAKLLGG